MGFTYRAPQESLEQLQKAVEIIQLIQEISTNKDIAKTVKELSKELLTAQELSDEQKKAVFDAQEILAQSKEAVEELEKESLKHSKKVSVDLADIERQKQEIALDKEAQTKAMGNVQKNADEKLSEAKDKLATAVVLAEETESQQKKLAKDKIEFAKEVETHLTAVDEFNKSSNSIADELETRRQKLDEREKQLNDANDALELRKQRLNEVLSAGA